MFNFFNSNDVFINGKKIKVENCSSICVRNGKLFIDGQEYKDEEIDNKEVVNVVIEGNVENVNCGGSVIVNGNVNGDIDCGGSFNIEGDVTGNIDCGGSCNVTGRHKGNIDAGGSVSTHSRW